MPAACLSPLIAGIQLWWDPDCAGGTCKCWWNQAGKGGGSRPAKHGSSHHETFNNNTVIAIPGTEERENLRIYPLSTVQGTLINPFLFLLNLNVHFYGDFYYSSGGYGT
jgi:hypothetical protein